MFKEFEVWLIERYGQMPTPDVQIPGLSVINNFIDPAEHDRLLAAVDCRPWLTDLKRRVQHYGFRYDYKSRSVDPSLYLGPLPGWVAPLASRFQHERLIGEAPDQVIVNEYEPGQGIASHVDCVPCFGDTILSLTLGSSCVMNFSNIRSGQEVGVLLEPRGLVIVQGESRYDWKHGIAARKSDEYQGVTIKRGRRISLTFRKVIPRE